MGKQLRESRLNCHTSLLILILSACHVLNKTKKADIPNAVRGVYIGIAAYSKNETAKRLYANRQFVSNSTRLEKWMPSIGMHHSTEGKLMAFERQYTDTGIKQIKDVAQI